MKFAAKVRIGRGMGAGAGSSLFHDANSNSGSIVSFELHSEPFFIRNCFSLRYVGVVTGHATGDVFVGVGLSSV